MNAPEGYRIERSGPLVLCLKEGVGDWLKSALESSFANVPAADRTPVVGRGMHFTFPTPEGRALARTVRRGGMISFMGDRLLSADRIGREIRMLREAARAGLEVPELLGFSIRGGLFKRLTVVYREIEGVRTLQDAAPGDLEAIRTGARTARALHEAGILHGDLNCRNILLKEGHGFLIDFDAASSSRSEAAFRREAARLYRSLDKELGKKFSEEGRRAFVEAYAGGEDEALQSLCERRLRKHRVWWALGGR